MDIIDRHFIKVTADSPPRPILPVILGNPANGQEVRTFGIIDTGADECAFPADYAILTGHNLGAGAIKSVGTGKGVATAYSHTVSLEIDGYRIERGLIDFLPDLKFPLLGVQSFLSKFVLTIDYPKQVFSLTEK